MPSPTTKADETHRRILQAALDCFTHQGYHATTMDDIAAESETSKGTLYWHFSSKEDLLKSAVRWFFDTRFGPEALAVLETAPTATVKLQLFADATVDLIDEAQGIFNLFLEFWASSANREKSAETWLELLGEYRRVAAGIIADGVERGEFEPVDAQSLAWALTATYDGLAAYALLKPDLDLQRIHRAFIDAFLAGLQHGSVAPEGAGL